MIQKKHFEFLFLDIFFYECYQNKNYNTENTKKVVTIIGEHLKDNIKMSNRPAFRFLNQQV